MDKEKIIELENYIFAHHTKTGVAASATADIIGVLIGVKPSAISSFNIYKFTDIDPSEIIELFGALGLRVLFFPYEYTSMGRLVRIEEIYVAHDYETAAKLHKSFTKMRSSIDDFGQTFDKKTWGESSREIGYLLGYPDTAVEYFIAEQDIDNKERRDLMDKYRFYIHSPEHHEHEYQIYDRKIYQALNDYAPRTAKIFSADQHKKWL